MDLTQKNNKETNHRKTASLHKSIKRAVLLTVGLLFLCALSSCASASMDPTEFLTSENAEEVNMPTSEEELESVFSRKASLDQTVKLATIIESARAEDRAKIEQHFRKKYAGKTVTFECDTDSAKTYVCDDVDGYGTPYEGLGSRGNSSEDVETADAPASSSYGTQYKTNSKYKGPSKWESDAAKLEANISKNTDKVIFYGSSSIRKWTTLSSDMSPIPVLNNGFGGSTVNDCVYYADRLIVPGKPKAIVFYAGTNDIAYGYSPSVVYDRTIDFIEYIHQALPNTRIYYVEQTRQPKRDKLWKKMKQLNSKVEKYAKKDALVTYISTSKSLNAKDDSSQKKYFVSDLLHFNAEGYKEWTNAIKPVLQKGMQADQSTGQGTSTATTTAEKIATTAEKLAWPEGTKVSTYGKKATNEEISAAKAVGLKSKANCAAFARIVLRNALNNATVPNLLDSAIKAGSVSAMQKVVNPYGLTVSSWDGKMGSLKRGDILIYKRKNASNGRGQHICIYLGNNRVAEANYPKGYYGYISKKKPGAGVLTTKNAIFYYVLRATGSNNATGASGEETQPRTIYTEPATVGELEKNDSSVKSLASGDPAQSFAYHDGKFYVQRIKGSGGKIEVYDTSGELLDQTDRISELRHGNGLTYSTKDNLLYTVTCLGVGDNTKAYSIDPETLTVKDEISLPCEASGIAYDESTDRWIFSSGSKIKIYKGDMKTQDGAKLINKIRPWKAAQDITAKDGIIYACTYGNYSAGTAGNNWIDMYDEETGDYYGGYSADYDEIESVVIAGSEIVALFNASADYMLFTGISVDSFGGSHSGPIVTPADMDILAAYSISLGNTKLVYDENGEDESVIDSVLNLIFSKKYKDINGKPIETYRFGENKGKINYEKDLEKKVDNWTFYDRENAEITEDGDQVHITINELPAHKVCKKMFGLEPYAEYVNAQAKPKGADEEGADTAAASDTSNSTVDASDPLLLLVNDDDANAVPSDYDPNLVEIDPNGEGLTAGHNSCKYISSTAKDSLLNMLSDCEKNAGKAIVQSSYRDKDTQKSLYDAAVAAGRTDTTKPGHSEHQTGLAADIIDASSSGWSDPLIKDQENTAAQKWLMANCQNYGFILRYPEGKESVTGIDYEPWHYRYVGVEYAKEIMASGLCLEEYLGADGVMTDGVTTNAEAIYTLSLNTAAMLFTGLEDASSFGAGSGDFPLPMDSDWAWTSPFGQRWGSKHEGVDLGVAEGTPIYSTCDGEVTRASYFGGHGNCVIVHAGDYDYYYSHMSKITVGLGRVTKGQKLGEVGNTGHSFGNHLHYQIEKAGVAIDPFPLFSPSIQEEMNKRKSADFG